MEIKVWIDKWKAGQTAFHQSDVEPRLIQYFSELNPGTALVPLCGKSLDLIWFADRGFKVVGVEASELACRSFFSENKISFTEKSEHGFICFESKSITLWCGDFFAFTPEPGTRFTAAYDRAALIALPDSFRIRYAAHLKEIISEYSSGDFQLLQISIEYAPGAIPGPPFSVGEGEIRGLYGNTFEIKKLESLDDHFPNGAPITESVYLFTKIPGDKPHPPRPE